MIIRLKPDSRVNVPSTIFAKFTKIYFYSLIQNHKSQTLSLFQTSVLKKYLKGIDQDAVNKAWEIFREHFHNPVIQENIRNSKEEQYQGEFLIDLFVNVLGYVKNPNPNFNITTELKNVKGAKKTDGAIINEDGALAVIELKGMNTTDLSKIETQAFGYKNNQPACVYVITSNFEKLRFYIDNAVDFEEFNLFQLSKERFEVLWLCLASEFVLKNIPKKIKDESLYQEENITKQLYKDYSAFRTALFDSMQRNNPEYDKLTLFKKTQKLLDRFLFIFFAEDRLLLPPNSIRIIIDDWKQLKELDAYKPLYQRYVKYFGYLNNGYKGKKHDIFAYNGGLFLPDEILDNLKIDDDLLEEHTQRLSNYDFESEVSVNILGHIFEHSLNEIEEIQAGLEGAEIDKKKTKRKKDGVFYTPKYITKYIVDNTVGKLCYEKKTELGIDESDYEKDRKGRRTETLKKLQQKLETYRNWLLQITICDPACGSGAFLNQALEFLIEEHRYIDELNAKLLGESFILSDVENSILENNLYGVDINEESVQIAKLSLWLRTAKKGRKLSSLNTNIKCGNSIIFDFNIAGKKAFKWSDQFKTVFNNGGFDVIIGNPPYVRSELFGEWQTYLQRKYQVYNASADLFCYFYEQSFKLLKPYCGMFGFISNTFDKTKAGQKLRHFLQTEISLLKYIDFTEVQIFDGATTYPVVITAQNKKSNNHNFQYIKIPKEGKSSVDDINLHRIVNVEQSSLEQENWIFKSKSELNLILKLKENKTVRDIYGKCYYGIKTALNDAFIIPKSYKNGIHVKPIYEGKELSKWVNSESVQQLILFESKWTKKEYGSDINEEIGLQFMNRDFPNLMSHILLHKERAKKRYDQGDFFWELRNCAYYKAFESPKIVFPNLQNSNKFSYDCTGSYINAPAVILPTNHKYLVSILNSKLVWFFLKNICVIRNGGYIEVKPQYFEQIPIANIGDKTDIDTKTNLIISLTTNFQKLELSFIKYLKSQFSFSSISKKIQKWHDFDFGNFIKELNKLLKNSRQDKLSKSEEIDWMELFEEKKNEILELKIKILETEDSINKIVYRIYKLTNEEIQLIEND